MAVGGGRVGKIVEVGGTKVGGESGGKVGTRVRVGGADVGGGAEAHATANKTSNNIAMAKTTRLTILISPWSAGGNDA